MIKEEEDGLPRRVGEIIKAAIISNKDTLCILVDFILRAKNRSSGIDRSDEEYNCVLALSLVYKNGLDKYIRELRSDKYHGTISLAS